MGGGYGMGGGYSGGDYGGYGGGDDYGSGDWNDDYGMCCEVKAVTGSRDRDMNGYYMLMGRMGKWEMPKYCNSPCAYVKMEDYMNLMAVMGSGMDNMGMGGMEMGSGLGKTEERQIFSVMGQKYH